MPLFSDAAPATGSPIFQLAAGQTFQPDPGWYWVHSGLYANLQRYDSRAGVWRYAGAADPYMRQVYFDGTTARLCNPTGCAVAAVVTTAGSGYATAPTVTPSAGASTWQAIVGGAVSTTATITSAGSGYTYPPVLLIEQPPNFGVQATGSVAISNGTISAVTITNQGAGYLYPPNVSLFSDFRDMTGSNGQVSVGLTGAGTVTAVVCTNHGNPITSGTIPTLAFGSGSAAATIVMDWTVTSVSVTTAGAGYSAAASVATAVGAGGFNTSTAAYVGTDTSVEMSAWREAKVAIVTSAAGGLTTPTIIDGGRYSAIPAPAIYSSTTPTTVGALAFTMGGVTADVLLLPMQQI
jgi:hypothetical protein